MKKMMTLGLALLASMYAKSQISTEEAREVDSTAAITYLTSGNFHTENIHPTSNGDTLVWDAGSGLYTDIPDHYVSWSHTDKVNETTANDINNQPGAAYKTFNLNNFDSSEGYKNFLENWLESIGVATDTYDHENIETKLFPNPIKNNATINADLKAGEEYNLLITSMDGKTVRNYSGIAGEDGIEKTLNLGDLSKGTYIFTIQTDKTTYSTKGVKQ